MKRDMNVIRDLLLFYESDCSLPYPSADADSIREHMIMLIEAGFIDGELSGPCYGSPRDYFPHDGRTITKDGVQHMMYPLTWSGHDFLAAARDQKMWNKAVIAAGGMTFEIIKEYLQTLLRQSLGIQR